MKLQKLRFTHELLESHFAAYDPRTFCDLMLLGEEEEANARIKAAREGKVAPFDIEARRRVCFSVAGMQTLVRFLFNDDRLPVGRYVVSESLGRALRDTQPPEGGFDEADIRLPFPATMIRWPNGEETYAVEIRTFNEELGRLTNTEIVTTLESQEVEDAIFFLQYGPNRNFPRLETWYAYIGRHHFPATSPADEIEEVNERQAMLANVLAYLTLNEADVRECVPKKVKRPGETSRERFYSYRRLGDRLRYDATGNGKPLDHRVPVQGHWRMQAHGPRHTLRKRLWIYPHWRGPKDGEVINRVRVAT